MVLLLHLKGRNKGVYPREMNLCTLHRFYSFMNATKWLKNILTYYKLILKKALGFRLAKFIGEGKATHISETSDLAIIVEKSQF